MKGVDLSVVVPVYRDYSSLKEIVSRFKDAIGGTYEFEIVFVNDGNVQNEVFAELEQLCQSFPFVKVVHLSRNFGQHIAIAAGMKNASGAYILVMDSDLQFDPEECLKMYQWASSQEITACLSRVHRKEHGAVKRFFANTYYRLASILMELPYQQNVGSTFLVNRHVANGLSAMADRRRLTIPMIFWLSGDIKYFPLTHKTRQTGKSGYSFKKLIHLAINDIVTFSTLPLYAAFGVSLVFAGLATSALVYWSVQYFMFSKTYLSGWLSVVFFVLASSTVILVCIGILGLYVARIFESSNSRPLYFVQENKKCRISLFED